MFKVESQAYLCPYLASCRLAVQVGCHEQNVCVLPQNPYVEALLSNVKALGGGAFERLLGSDEVMRVDLSGWD